jgi:hypothetical protein
MAVILTRATIRIVAKKSPGGATNIDTRISNSNDIGALYKMTMIRHRDRPPTHSGDTVDSLQISQERKGGRPSTRNERGLSKGKRNVLLDLNAPLV